MKLMSCSVRAYRSLRVLATLSILATLTACSGSLLETNQPASTRYVIATPPPASAPTPSTASLTDLAIGRPDVAPGLDTDQIAAIRGHELDFFRGALWGGPVLQIVQAFLVTTFQEQQRFRSVAAEQSRIAADYMLDIEVRDFQAEYGTNPAPLVRTTLVCRLIRIKDRTLVHTMTATATRQASENRMSAVTTAFEGAMQDVALQLSRDTATAVAADRDGV